MPIGSGIFDYWPPRISALLNGSNGMPGMYSKIIDEIGLRGTPLGLQCAEVLSKLTDLPVRPATIAADRNEPRVIYSPARVLCQPDLDVHWAFGKRINRISLGRDSVEAISLWGDESIRARQGILCCGAIENFRLCTGLQEESSGDRGQRFTSEIVDHLVQGFICEVASESLDAVSSSRVAKSQLFVCDSFSAKSNLFISLEPSTKETLIIDCWEMGEQKRQPNSIVTYAPSADRVPRVQVSLCAEDNNLLAEQRERLKSIQASLSSILKLKIMSQEKYRFGAPQYTFRAANSAIDCSPMGTCIDYFCPLGTVDHESCTTSIGNVVDEDMQVIGCKNVHVCGSSVFPRAGAANPSLTVLALARLLAQRLCQ